MKLASCFELFCCAECVQNGTSVCLHLSVCFRYRSFHSSQLLRSQYNEIIQQKFLSLFELDLREFRIKYNTFITVMPKCTNGIFA